MTDEERIEALRLGRALLSDGRWVALRPQYLSERFALEDIRKLDGEKLEPNDLYRKLLAILEPAVIGTSWGGTVAETTPVQMGELFGLWPAITEAAVMDPTSANGSGTNRSQRRSRPARGKPPVSASPSSTKS